MMLNRFKETLSQMNTIRYSGRVSKLIGLTIESEGPAVQMGEVCLIYPLKQDIPVVAEVVGFKGDTVLLMPLGDMQGLGPGSKVVATGETLTVSVGMDMMGRVLDGLGQPIDDLGAIQFTKKVPVNNDPPNPLTRKKIQQPLPLGIKAIDGLLTCGQGQRIGVFAGSGVGKSTLMGMIARNTTADVNVIALIGERGREVREFIENDLGEEGLSRSVLVVATSDKPALVRVKGALLATSIAEYFRDMGMNVVLMMDSLTRFSLAQREIGLAVGEPPVTRGYTPSVFAMLPRLLERAGNSADGSITGLYTVLVDGDDMNEPISDTVRGILDGHIILSRRLATQGQYPAIDVLGSLSRVMPNVIEGSHMAEARRFKEILATYYEAEDLIAIGAYAPGTNPAIDLSIKKLASFKGFLKQNVGDKIQYNDVLKELSDIVKE